ncbi:MAG: tRNA pseudouridine(55) synthase TruB [Myxococcales bacterium]|nr:MAG: tRNA pseudouridine(55) synthase TruB [Myxococcales bacterium]
MVAARGRADLHGLVIVDKPERLTSADVVDRLKRRFGLAKVGHAGTLDPIATGLLPLCINEGTKLAAYLSESGKAYRVRMKLGEATDTYDCTGQVIETASVTASAEAIADALTKFVGPLMQTPPVFSAKKQQGKPLYKRVRAGEEIVAKPVAVELYSVQETHVESPFVEFTVRTSKGFYIRSLCHDLGRMLGCGGHMTALRRTAHGPFTETDGLPLVELLDGGDPLLAERLIPLESERLELPLVRLSPQLAQRVTQGLAIAAEETGGVVLATPLEAGQTCRALGADGRLLALLSVAEPSLRWPELPSRQAVLIIARGMTYASQS